MISEKTKQIINKAKIPASLKNRLSVILVNLEDNCLIGLANELSRKDSNRIAKYLVDLWENFSRITSGLKKGDTKVVKDFFELLNKVDYLTNDDDRIYLLYLVLDVRTIFESPKFSISSQQYEEILNYEIDLFWHLPKEEVAFLLSNRLLFLENRVNLLEYIKIVIWENDWDYTKNFSKNFSDLLIQNDVEKLGSKTIGAWVQDYFNFSSPSSFRADVVQVAEFLIKDPSVQKLSEQERKTLSEILKLYVWFLKPEMNEDEILAYKEEIRQRQAEMADQVILKEIELSNAEQNYQGTKPSPPIVPAPKNQPVQKPMEEVRSNPNSQYPISNDDAGGKGQNPRQQSPEAPALGGQAISNEGAASQPPVTVVLKNPGAVVESLAKPVVKPVNIEEVMKKKPMEEAFVAPGLKMWNINPPLMPKKPTVDIDKKLEDLEKRIKN